MRQRLLSGKKLFLFDLDGVFYKGKESRVLIGGKDAISHLRKLGKSVAVLTNNSTDTVETIHRRLLEVGIRFREEEILTSGLLTAEFLKEEVGSATYFLVGEEGLDKEMRRLGHRRTEGKGAEFVVVGLDRKVTYDKLDTASRLVREGARLVATHDSRLYMYKTGPAMATGPLVRAIEYASGHRATVVGKPSPRMFNMALARVKCRAEEAVMVGDQLDTDILGARRAGVDAVLVTTGVDKDPGRYDVVAVLGNVDELVKVV